MGNWKWTRAMLISGCVFLVIVALMAFGGEAFGAGYQGVKTVSDNIAFPVMCLDTTSALSVTKPDSFTVIVWHEGVGDNTVTYEASGNTEVAWIAGYESGGGTPDTT